MTQRNDQVTANVQIGGMINYTPCSIEVGEVTTLPAGSDATVTNTGDDHEVVLDFGIPQGAKGDTGDQGETGKSAYQAAVEAGYEGTEEQFGTSLITIDESATAAAASATAAAASATAASGSATTASNAATTATTKAGEAATSAANAATSASSAGSHATTAQNYATQASTYASNAANSATNAATYASNAASSASNAASMASSASTSASTASAVLEDPDFVAVAGAVEDISTVATNISDVTSVATSIADVGAVADDLTNIDNVADDLTNIDTVVANLPDIQDKQNKVLTNSVILGGETQTTVEGALEAISEDWVKPAEWIDIRSGAIDNSIYFLVGHAADYSKYPEFSVYAEISNSGTYDVYVDGFKQATTASATDTTLNWQTLALQTGWDVTYPEALRTHIVRVTPSVSTNTITKIYLAANSSVNQGVLWAHFAITNGINLVQAFSINNNNIKFLLLEAVTAVGDVIKISVNGSHSIFRNCENLQYIPVLDFQKISQVPSIFVQNCKKLRKVRIKNMGAIGPNYNTFEGCYNLRKIEADGVFTNAYGSITSSCYELETIPPFKAYSSSSNITIIYNRKIKDTVLDFSYLPTAGRFLIYGSEVYPQSGIKGIILNPAMKIVSTSSPQIDVRYDGLDRSALVNLFKSMPYNVGYTVVGSPTITSGVASGFSSSNSLRTSVTFPNDYTKNSYEFQVKIQTPSTIQASNIMGVFFRYAASDGFSYTAGGRLQWFFGGGTNILQTEANYIQPNSVYVIRGIYQSDTLSLYVGNSVDNLQLVSSQEINDFTIETARAAVLGVSLNNASPFNGSIDLNSTYIKVNGVPWFTGKAATTKTCNIVGCTGTADLTQDDKNIALNKGWELTVA